MISKGHLLQQGIGNILVEGGPPARRQWSCRQHSAMSAHRNGVIGNSKCRLRMLAERSAPPLHGAVGGVEDPWGSRGLCRPGQASGRSEVH